MPDARRRPTQDEVRYAYQLFLGREAENEQVVAQMVEGADEGWLRGFAISDEFSKGTAWSILKGAVLPQQSLAPYPSSTLRAWVSDQVPLTAEGRMEAGDARTWAALLLAIFSDRLFHEQVLGTDSHPITADLVNSLRAQAHGSAATVVGGVDRVLSDEIRGWIVDTADPNRILVVELRIDGRFAAAATANVMQRDVQDRYDSHGRHGFVLRYRQDEARGKVGTLVEQASGLIIAEFPVPAPQAPPLDLVATLRAELGDVRRLLGRIESLLPEFQGHFTFGLSSYAAYFDAYYGSQIENVPVSAPAADMTVILIAVGATPIELSQSLAGIALQRHPPSKVIILHEDGERGEEERSAVVRGRSAMPDGIQVEARRCDREDWSSSLNAAVEQAASSAILIVRAFGVLAADAVGTFFRSLDAGATMVYADEDGVDLTIEGRQDRHRDPVFRTSFDRDLLQQVDCVGDVVAMRRDLALRLGFSPHTGPATLFDFLLRIDAEDRAGIVHLPRILFHRARRGGGATPVQERLAIVRQRLVEEGGAAEAELHQDAIGAQTAGAIRLRHSIPEGTRAAIIIPTRDRLDLLGPCLAAINNAARTSRTALEVIVVDNGSELSTTHAVLTTLEQAEGLRLLRLDGPFNWALMNNRAAEITDAEVLIFLNNDTIGIGRSCWDELAMQALRPGVGAVGARLLYEDGTIQHAGMVAGSWPGFVQHEGMGDAGSYPGYLGRHSLLRRVSAVTGACLATRADIFRAVGGFDETMPVGGNDADYCFRVRAAGFDILYDPYATLYHFESKSRGYDDTAEKRREAGLITERLRERWGEQFGKDPFYNGHFDRLTPAMTKLRPPPPL